MTTLQTVYAFTGLSVFFLLAWWYMQEVVLPVNREIKPHLKAAKLRIRIRTAKAIDEFEHIEKELKKFISRYPTEKKLIREIEIEFQKYFNNHAKEVHLTIDDLIN